MTPCSARLPMARLASRLSMMAHTRVLTQCSDASSQ